MVDDDGRYYMSGANKMGELLMQIRAQLNDGTITPHKKKVNEQEESSSNPDDTGKRKRAEGEDEDEDSPPTKKIPETAGGSKGKGPALTDE